MRLAVLVALDGFASDRLEDGASAEYRSARFSRDADEGEHWARRALARLGFRVVPSLRDVPHGATLLVHITGGVEGAVTPLRSLAEQVSALEPESALFLAELAHAGPPDDSLVAAEYVEVVRETLGARERGCSALIAVRPASGNESRFAFTELVVRAAEEAEDARSARLSEIVERLRAMPERHAVAQGYAHVRGPVDFEIGSNEGPAYAPLLALADTARDAHEWEYAVAGYRAALMVARYAEDRAAAYARIGSVERARGASRDAKRAYEKAYELQPDSHPMLDALVELSSEVADWGRYVDLARVQVAHLSTPAEKADLHFAIARTLGTEFRDLPAAVVELEAARALDPLRDDVLEALRRGYRVLGEWKKLIEVTGVLADEGPSDAERSARRLAQARIALDQLGDKQLAIAFLDAALTEDPTNDEALDVLVEVRTSRGEIVQLGRALEDLAARYEEIGDTERARDARRCIEGLPSTPPVVELSSPNLEVDPDEPDEDSGALVSPVAAVEISGPHSATHLATDEATRPIPPLPPTLEELPPDSLLDYEEVTRQGGATRVPKELPSGPGMDVPIFVADETSSYSALVNPATIQSSAPDLTPLPETPRVPSQEDDANALLELEEAVGKTPLDPQLHARQFEIHARAGNVDRAFLSALALEELGATMPEHEAAIAENRHEGPLRLRALLDAPAWESLRGPGSDDVVETLFGAVSPAAVAAQIQERFGRRKLVQLDPEKKQSSTSTVSIVASFQWAARVLGVTCPDLYILDEVPGDIAAVPSADPSTAIGPGALSGLPTKELAFLASRHLTYYRREHAPLIHFASLPELTILVLACVQMELPAVPIPHSVAPAVAALRGRMGRHLTEADRTSMAAAVERLESRSGRLDLAAWVRSVELTSARAGLFMCGDLRSALARLRAERPGGSATFEEARRDLVAFSVSRAHADLRAEFGLISSPRTSGVRPRDEVGDVVPREARAG
jgi:tetratricopeptide (TPR) repeat protein